MNLVENTIGVKSTPHCRIFIFNIKAPIDAENRIVL